jgi:argininosuccinate lyase
MASAAPAAPTTSGPAFVRSPAIGFLSSLSVDRTLAPFDLAGSIAHAEMLGRTGIVPRPEAEGLVRGLRSIGAEIAAGTFPWRADLEDVHTNVEVRLTELLGPVGGKLHTARSRNDQIALDERLYLRAAVAGIGGRLLALERTLVGRAGQEQGTPMPGYTHLQRAQPGALGHHLLAHFWRFDRDLDRLLATAVRASVSPLGAGALLGSTLPIDPGYVAERLGFGRPFENSLDAVSDRDYFAELLFDLALLSVHASALGEELVLFASKEFGFLDRTPELGSGSSAMPQKRNPDVAELVRGKTGRVVGDLVALLTTLKGLPLAYDRDLQEDKAPVFDAVATVELTLEALAGLAEKLRFDRARLGTAASDPELYATDVAEHLVAGGMPFREAHEAVAASLRSGAQEAAPEETRRRLLALASDLGPVLDPKAAADRRSSPGGPGATPIARQIALARERLDERERSLSSLARSVDAVDRLVREAPA